MVQPSPARVTLPVKIHPEKIWSANSQIMKPALDSLTGTTVNFLRYVTYFQDEEATRTYFVLLAEPRNAILPSDINWQPLEKILEKTDMPSALQEGLLRWQSERNTGVIPERRAPWALRGWYAGVDAWVENQVSRLGRGAIQNIEPIKSWSISCVLKVITESGILYFKATRDLPLFVNEGVTLTNLAKLYPRRVPRPVALAPENGWMLLDDFGGAPDDDAPLDNQVRLMQDYARLQIDSSQKIKALLTAGCIDRRLDILLSQIEPLLADELSLSLLNFDEREQVKQLAPRLRELLVELTSLPIPSTIIHGDLHAGNVIISDDSFLYFDWTDAAVSHPFFDMIHIFTEADETKKSSLQAAYLEIWEQSFSKSDVWRAWQLANVLYGFYHAVSYQYITHGIEDLVQPELNFAYYFLRKLLAGLNQLNSL